MNPATPPPQGEQANDEPPDSKAHRQSPANSEGGGPSGRQSAHTARTLFSIPFKSPMTDQDLARLHASLDLATYIKAKPGVSGASPGVAPLDFWSGLFLQSGGQEDEWVFQARTWGNPPEEAVREWHVRAALAAHELDRSVPVPPREPAGVAESPAMPLGRAANKRLARLGRRLLHL